MKKFLMLFSALALLSIVTVDAQRLNKESHLKKIAASDAAIVDAKKSAKASTWVARGDVYYQAAIAPVKNIFWGAESRVLDINYGDCESKSSVVLNNKEYTKMEYPSFTAYLRNNQIVAWDQKDFVVESIDEAFNTAIEAYMQAYELDFETSKKVHEGLDNIFGFYRQMGNIYNELGQYRLSAESFSKANDVQHLELYPSGFDVELTYTAGYLHIANSSKDSTSFAPGEALFAEAIEKGYCDFEDKKEDVEEQERGSIYYYLFHCAYAQRHDNPEKLLVAKQALIDGLTRYPRNEDIFDGLFMIYTAEEGVGDPLELLDAAKDNIKADEKSVNAWYGLSRIYYVAKDYDNAIESFKQVVVLDPEMFMSHFYLGVCYMHKADDIYNGMKDDTYTDRATYDAATGRLNDAYALSIPYFEAAYELKNNDRNTLSYLKQLCFRLRDDEAMMVKYEKYNALYEAL